MHRLSLVSAVLALGLPGAAAAQDAQAGYGLFEMHCAQCHGTEAQGDGPMAELLSISPPDLTQLVEDGRFPMARVARQIDGRDPMLAHGGTMPIYGRAFEGEDVVVRLPSGQPMITSKSIADLIAWLESVQVAR